MLPPVIRLNLESMVEVSFKNFELDENAMSFSNLNKASGNPISKINEISRIIGQDLGVSAFTERLVALMNDFHSVPGLENAKFVFRGQNIRYLDINKLESIHSSYKIKNSQSIHKIAASHLHTMTPDELDADWKLLDFFGHIKVVGREGSERDLVMQKEFGKIGLKKGDYEYSDPVDGSIQDESLKNKVVSWSYKNEKGRNGVLGCTLAHYNLILDTKSKYDAAVKAFEQDPESLKARSEVKKYSSVLIMEDNCAFGILDGQTPILKKVGKQFREVMQSLPLDWDMFYLMLMTIPVIYSSKKISKLLCKSSFGFTTKCFAVNHTAYDRVIKGFKDEIESRAIRPADHITGDLHGKLNVYAPIQSLTYRIASMSQVGNSGDGSSHWQPNPRLEYMHKMCCNYFRPFKGITKTPSLAKIALCALKILSYLTLVIPMAVAITRRLTR